MTVILKKEKRNLLFILSFYESRWVMIKIFSSFLHFYSPVFSHLINNTEWMNGYWVLLKKVHTRASRESPSPLSTKTSCSLWVRKRKKFNFVPSFLSLTYYYYLILSVKCVCSFFSLSGPVNNSDRMQTWGHVQSCLEIRKCQHIYIYIYTTYVTSTRNSYQYKLKTFSFLHFSPFVVIV